MSAAERRVSTLERVTTGIARLDELLEGGVPRNSVVFIAGLPGTGKTILSEQSLFADAAQGRTGLYLSTVSEPVLKVPHFLQGFTFFRPDLFGSKVIYGIIYLRYVEAAGEVKRAIGVLKMRGSRHDLRLRELVNDPPRISVGVPLTEAGMLGEATRREAVEAGAGQPGLVERGR